MFNCFCIKLDQRTTDNTTLLLRAAGGVSWREIEDVGHDEFAATSIR